MNLNPAFDLDAYSVQFRPHREDGRVTAVSCLIWAYGAWNNVNGKAARETFAVDSVHEPSTEAAFAAALVKLRARQGVAIVEKAAAVDLEDLF